MYQTLSAFAILRLMGLPSILSLRVELVVQQETQVSHHQRCSLRHIAYALGLLAVVSSTELSAEKKLSIHQVLLLFMKCLSWLTINVAVKCCAFHGWSHRGVTRDWGCCFNWPVILSTVIMSCSTPDWPHV